MAPSKKDKKTPIETKTEKKTESKTEKKAETKPETKTVEKTNKLCDVDGCENVATKNKRCSDHPMKCSYEGCSSTNILRMSRCKEHQHRCSWDGCSAPVARGTRCALHPRCAHMTDGERCTIPHKTSSEYCAYHSKQEGEEPPRKPVKETTKSETSIDKEAKKSAEADPVKSANDSDDDNNNASEPENDSD